MHLLRSKNYCYIIKIKNILDVISSIFWGLIDLSIKRVSKPDVILRYLLLEVVGKKLISKKTLLVIKILDLGLRQLVQLWITLRIGWNPIALSIK